MQPLKSPHKSDKDYRDLLSVGFGWLVRSVKKKPHSSQTHVHVNVNAIIAPEPNLIKI